MSDGKSNRRLPPVETRWQKGQSGNPRGRPRKRECLTSLLKSELDRVCPLDRDGRTWKELVALAIVQLDLKGSWLLIQETWDRIEGRVGEGTALTDRERAALKRKLCDPHAPIVISRKTINEIRAIYNLEPLPEDFDDE